ncbi:MAG: methyltransferase [Vicinamibacterales bacterium]
MWKTDLTPFVARYRRDLTSAEFLKAVRALSARYVERRAHLADRSPLDSAGKRAAFAAFYAPLHFLTTCEAVRALGAATTPLDRVIDLGCGTGAASAAWALEFPRAPELVGVDSSAWAAGEARWTWRTLGLSGRSRRGDLVQAAVRAVRSSPPGRTALLLAWSVNELNRDARHRLLTTLSTDEARAVSVLILEPLARRVTPWWDEWVHALRSPVLRADEWKFDVPLPPALAEIDRAAGFRRAALGARTLWRPARL